MDHSNNFGSYCPLTDEELQAYPFLVRTQAIEQTGSTGHNILTNRWGITGEPDLTTGYESIAPATQYQYTNPVNGYAQPLSHSQYWEGHQAQPQLAGPSNQGGTIGESFCGYYNAPINSLFVNQSVMGAPTVPPAPSSMSLGYCYGGIDGSGPSTSTFYPNAYPTFQHCSGPTRVGMAHPWRFQPYGTPHARATEHANAEAGPSSLSLLRVPYVGLQTPHPPGGLSEVTIGVVTTQPTTEEDGDSKPARKRVPRGMSKPHFHREQMKGDKPRLCAWVKEKRGLPSLPSFKFALTAAVDEIRKIRPKSEKSFLLTCATKQTEPVTTNARRERKKRTEDRKVYEDLSCYYPRDEGQLAWTRPKLLATVVRDLEESTKVQEPSEELESNENQGPSCSPEGSNADPGPSDELAPSASTPEADAPDT